MKYLNASSTTALVWLENMFDFLNVIKLTTVSRCDVADSS